MALKIWTSFITSQSYYFFSSPFSFPSLFYCDQNDDPFTEGHKITGHYRPDFKLRVSSDFWTTLYSLKGIQQLH